MTYQVESLNGCTKKLVFNFEQVDLSKQIQVALIEKQKTTNLKGFRKGKAPLTMVQQVYGPQVENDALYRFVSEQFYEAIKKENLRTVGYPSFGKTDYEPGKKVSFEAVVEILPDFEIKDYSSYSFKKDSSEVTSEDMETVKKQFLNSKATITECAEGTAIVKGMSVVLNFEGQKPDGTKPDNMKASEYLLEIGSGQFIPGFEEGLVGLKKGDKKDLKLTFPADYHEEELKNAPVTFAVEIIEVKEKQYPDFNDELAKEFGYENVADFTQKTTQRMKAQKTRDAANKLHQQVLEKLVAEHAFDVPQSLIEDQKTTVKSDLEKNLAQQGFNKEMMEMYFEKWSDDVTAKAEFQVRSGLILDKLSRKFNVEATEADLEKKIEEMATYSQMKKEDISNFYLKNAQVKKNLMYAIREEKTFDKLLSGMKVS
jgi:trigger factor